MNGIKYDQLVDTIGGTIFVHLLYDLEIMILKENIGFVQFLSINQ